MYEVTEQAEHDPPTEAQRVEGWRMFLLTEAGMTFTDARILAALETWRIALGLLEQGRPAHLAFEIAR